MRSSCSLFLQDGSRFSGLSFGFPAPYPQDLKPGQADRKAGGEVVFNTGMTGYHEILTDPSYTAQLVVMTYPHIGNYGALDEWSEIGPEANTSGRPGIKCAGMVIRSYYEGPVPAGRITLEAFLQKHKTPGITDVDTRKLTLILRDKGSQTGLIVMVPKGQEDFTPQDLQLIQTYLNRFPSMEGCDLTPEVGTEGPVEFNSEGHPHFVMIDSGIKMNIIREITSRGARVTVLPDQADKKLILEKKPDAVLFSSGPGDPSVLGEQIALVKSLVGTLPVFGICLGHQLISQALGGKTYKMKFGHHGLNNPVRDELTGKVFVTSQNHGFAVEEASLPPDVGVWFRNANDNTIEGVYHKTLNVKCAQFHPEAAPGPQDSSWIFQSFIDATVRK